MKNITESMTNVRYSFKLETYRYWPLTIGYLFSLIALIVGVFIWFAQIENDIYKFLYIIPIVYGCLNLLFLSVYKRISLFKSITLILMFIRYSAIPCLINFEGFLNNLYHLIYNFDSVILATFLICYEMFFIFFVIWILEKKAKVKGFFSETVHYDFKKSINFGNLNPIMLVIVFLTVALYVRYPALLNFYYFIFDGSIQETTFLNFEIINSSIPKGLRWIGYTFGEITRYAIMMVLLSMLYKRYEKNISNIYIHISIILVLFNAIISSTRQMAGLIMTVVLFTQIIKMYPQKKKWLLKLLSISMVIILIVLLFSYFSQAASYHSLSSIAESYTNGFYEVYQSIMSFDLVRLGLFERFEMLFIGDSLGFINIISSLVTGLDVNNSTLIYNYYLYGEGISGGKIVPMISQGYLYFGLIFSPIFSMVFIYLMYKIEIRVYKAKGSYVGHMFMGIVLAVAPFMYNYSIVLVLLTSVALPIFVASLINTIRLTTRRW